MSYLRFMGFSKYRQLTCLIIVPTLFCW